MSAPVETTVEIETKLHFHEIVCSTLDSINIEGIWDTFFNGPVYSLPFASPAAVKLQSDCKVIASKQLQNWKSQQNVSLCVCNQWVHCVPSYTAMQRLLLLFCLFKCVIVGLLSTKKCTLNHKSPRLLSKTRKIRATKLSNGELTDK